ncbi:MAG TPA: amidase [Xanthobacteraceae bacterium]|nr:amidase [Xanthobacteraceae bacterium]
MDPLWSLSATALAGEIARGAASAEELARACLDRVEQTEDAVRAFAHLDPAHVLAQARDLDEARRNGRPTGPLHGIPVGIKDIIDTADYATEWGSQLLAGRRPSRDATVVSKLRAAGAVIFGKTVTTELAYRHPGPTRNPHDPERTPGGSSSGSAAAVAAAMIPLAIGSQTAGSIIRPAAFCGVFGMKPSHGLVSRTGVMLHSRHLDHLGPYARTLDDIALILDVIAGYDPDDADTRPVAAPAFVRTAAERPPATPRLAFVRTPVWEKSDAEARAALETLADELGDLIARYDLPEAFAAAWDAQRTIMSVDMAHRHAEFVARGGEGASEPLREMVAQGRTVSAVQYLDALTLARRCAAALAEVFTYYDAIITPAATGVAPKGLGWTGDPVFNALWTLTGLPALSLPILQGENGMPLGVQLVGAAGHDARLLRTANWLLRILAEKA